MSDCSLRWKAAIASCDRSLQRSTMRAALYLSLIGFTLSGCNKPQETSVCVPVLPGWVTKAKPADIFVVNQVRLAGHGILWNGSPIDEETLTKYARQLAPKSPVPFLVFDPGPSPDCAFARQVRDVIDQNYPCRKGACGQGSSTNFIPTFNQQPPGRGH